MANDVRGVLHRVENGTQVIVERDAQPLAVMRAAATAPRTISKCIAMAEAHQSETGQASTLDAVFAADVEQIIRSRMLWNPPSWD